jgi:hypothetical protein
LSGGASARAAEVRFILRLDPFWPRRPDIIQPERGGISRRRFWIPAHGAFELCLAVALAFERAEPSSLEASSAPRWTRRSIGRLPLDLATCCALLSLKQTFAHVSIEHIAPQAGPRLALISAFL